MGALQTFQSVDGSVVTTPFGIFTRTDGSKYIVTPMYLPAVRLSRSYITVTNFGTALGVTNAEANPLYGEIPLRFSHSASAGSYGQNQSIVFNMNVLKRKGFVPYCMIFGLWQHSNQGTVQVFIDEGSTRVVNESYHSDHGKNNPRTRSIVYKWSIFDTYYTAPYYYGIGKRSYGNLPWLNNYVANKNNFNNITVTTGVHWGDRGGNDNVNVLIYFGLVSELIDVHGVYYAQPSYY